MILQKYKGSSNLLILYEKTHAIIRLNAFYKIK